MIEVRVYGNLEYVVWSNVWRNHARLCSYNILINIISCKILDYTLLDYTLLEAETGSNIGLWNPGSNILIATEMIVAKQIIPQTERIGPRSVHGDSRSCAPNDVKLPIVYLYESTKL